MKRNITITVCVVVILLFCNIFWNCSPDDKVLTILYNINNTIHSHRPNETDAPLATMVECRSTIHNALKTVILDEGTKDIVKLFAATINANSINDFNENERKGFTIQTDSIVTNRVLQYNQCSKELLSLAVCAIQRSSASYVQQWIAHYLIHGVSKIIIYDNSLPQSKDKQYFEEVTGPFVRTGFVVLHDWSPKDGSLHQLDAYNDCLEKYRSDFHWIGFLDIDEYIILNTPQHNCLPRYLLGFKDYPALVVQWRIMTSRGVYMHNHDRLLLEQYKWQYNHNRPQWVKSIVNTNKTIAMKSVHIGHYKSNLCAINSNKKKVCYEWHPLQNTSFQDIELRHFEGRDWQFAFLEKICGQSKQRIRRRDETA